MTEWVFKEIRENFGVRLENLPFGLSLAPDR